MSRDSALAPRVAFAMAVDWWAMTWVRALRPKSRGERSPEPVDMNRVIRRAAGREPAITHGAFCAGSDEATVLAQAISTPARY